MNTDLLNKYNIPGPRYTSYPTVPYWENQSTAEQWKSHVRKSFLTNNDKQGISVYVHLPYCESLCTYCGCNTRITVNHKVEEPYIKALLKEWTMYLNMFEEKPRIQEIHLGGGTPTFFSPANLIKLMEGISSTSYFSPDAEFSFEGHPNNTTTHHLESLYNAGFRRVSFGIQDFDANVQKAIHRIQSFEQVRSVTELARKTGYKSVNFDLIYGLPFQTLNTINDTINKVITLKPDRIAFYSYAHVPWIKPAQRGYSETDLPAPEIKRKLYETGRKLLIEAGYIETGMDHFALPEDSLSLALQNKTLYRNFMGYTTSKTKTLIGLGVSAIGDTWTAFSQNVKSVEGYLQKIAEGKLPLFRGHILTEEDLILRKHILQIICTGETKWNLQNEQCAFLYDSLELLHPMETDGLLVLDPQKLNVTETGKIFIRNICMAFDARLIRNQPQTQLFSQTV